MTVQADGTVRHEVVVELPLEEAFWKFADLDKIKPRAHRGDRPGAAQRR